MLLNIILNYTTQWHLYFKINELMIVCVIFFNTYCLKSQLLDYKINKFILNTIIYIDSSNNYIVQFCIIIKVTVGYKATSIN